MNRRVTITIQPPAIPLKKEAPAMPAPRNFTRQERIDVACLIGIIAVLLILLGNWIGTSTQPASAATSAPPTAQQPAIVAPAATLHSDSPTVTTVAAVECEEDMPCWECETMGNRICGPVVAPVAPAPAPADDYDPDEGEQIDSAELAEIAASLPPCAQEDSDGAPCYWDAQQRGNGLGRSFIWDGAEVVYTSN